MNENKVYFTYVRNKHNFPVACVASRKRLVFGQESMKSIEGLVFKVEYAVSSYNPIDPFNKKLAREIAEKRLAKHPHGWFTVLSDSDFKYQLMDVIMRDTYLPTDTRKAARRWVKEYLATTSETPMTQKAEVSGGKGQEGSEPGNTVRG